MRGLKISILSLVLMYVFSVMCFVYGLEKSDDFKVIGYYSGDLFNEPVEKLQTDKLTHVIYAFLIPKEDGSLVELSKPEQLKEIISQAHEDGAKVFIALGGWSYEGKPLEPVFKAVASSDDTRKILVENVCNLVEEYNFDGVEIDWEHPNANTIGDYEKLVVELSSALKQNNKELTAALNGAWSITGSPETSKLITEKCLNSFSFINVMAYDSNNTDHSPLWFSETSIDYWLNRGVPSEKIVLGMPLYARPSWMQYRHLVALNPEYAYVDYAPTTPLESYYNGMNTLREKTVIALSKAGGVMLFDVNEDTNDETSIVSMIDNLKLRTSNLSKDEIKKYVSVILNNKELIFLKEDGFGLPFINKDNRTMLPLRKPLEAIGAEVSYDVVNRMVIVKKDGTVIEVPIDENVFYVNGKKAEMDTTAIIKDNRTYVPLRAIFEALDYGIQWHSSSRTAFIFSNK